MQLHSLLRSTYSRCGCTSGSATRAQSGKRDGRSSGEIRRCGCARAPPRSCSGSSSGRRAGAPYNRCHMNVAERRKLTDVARGALPADLVIRGGTLLNVYTGELYPATVAVKGERIAYVGGREDMVGPRTTVLDATGKVLVPGYIDPHVHPAHVTTPSALARFVLPRGTTSVFADTLQLLELGGVRAFLRVADALTGAPLKFYWMIRPHAQSRTTDEPRRFRPADLVRALAHPRAVAVGGGTRWPHPGFGRPGPLRRPAPAPARLPRLQRP